ncbi:hypothetical protein FB451DRAFT_1442766 [Mycena latifolia]|nr:hypothetical protein FB451DRAFT_1442766 [Mycena latifolia]
MAFFLRFNSSSLRRLLAFFRDAASLGFASLSELEELSLELDSGSSELESSELELELSEPEELSLLGLSGVLGGPGGLPDLLVVALNHPPSGTCKSGLIKVDLSLLPFFFALGTFSRNCRLHLSQICGKASATLPCAYSFALVIGGIFGPLALGGFFGNFNNYSHTTGRFCSS